LTRVGEVTIDKRLVLCANAAKIPRTSGVAERKDKSRTLLGTIVRGNMPVTEDLQGTRAQFATDSTEVDLRTTLTSTTLQAQRSTL